MECAYAQAETAILVEWICRNRCLYRSVVEEKINMSNGQTTANSGKNIALLCGRGGSVSVRDKNLHPVLGRPMMTYPLMAAKSAKYIDDIFLSTDSAQMKDVARAHAVNIIDRPPALATATSQHVDTLIHALQHLERHDIVVKYLAVIMCNCATLPKGIVDRCIERLDADMMADSCVTGHIEKRSSPV